MSDSQGSSKELDERPALAHYECEWSKRGYEPHIAKLLAKDDWSHDTIEWLERQLEDMRDAYNEGMTEGARLALEDDSAHEPPAARVLVPFLCEQCNTQVEFRGDTPFQVLAFQCPSCKHSNRVAGPEQPPFPDDEDACRLTFQDWANELGLCLDEIFMSSEGTPEHPYEDNDTNQFWRAWLASWKARHTLTKEGGQ